jgi:hypothetical protein
VSKRINDRLKKVGKDLGGSGSGLIEVLFVHLARVIEQIHKSRSGQLGSRLRYETSTILEGYSYMILLRAFSVGKVFYTSMP